MPDEKEKTLAFTGIRPHKLPFGFNEDADACIAMKAAIKERLIQLIEIKNVRHFLSDMEMGIEMICAEIVMGLKKTYPAITLEAVISFESHNQYWPQMYNIRHRETLEKCAHVHIISKEHTETCLMERNRYMIDKCDAVLAVWNARRGGANAMLEYAEELKKPIFIIDPFKRKRKKRQPSADANQ